MEVEATEVQIEITLEELVELQVWLEDAAEALRGDEPQAAKDIRSFNP